MYKGWDKFVSELSYGAPTVEVWKLIKQIKNRYDHNNAPLNVNNTMITDIQTIADFFVEYFIKTESVETCDDT